MIPLDITDDLVHGHADLEAADDGLLVHRLPAWVRRRFPDPQLMGAEDQPAGVRLVLDTTASALELELQSTRGAFPGAERARGVVDVVVDGRIQQHDELTGGNVVITDPATGTSTTHPGPPHTTRIDLTDTADDGDGHGRGPAGGAAGSIPMTAPGRTVRRVEIWLTHSERIRLLALRAEVSGDAAGETAGDAPDGLTARSLASPVDVPGRRWVHYGSSISHGSNAATPLGTWPVLAARAAGVQLRNLGFSGSAMVDPFIARVMREAPADLLSLKIGINVVGGDMMRRRIFLSAVHGFLDTLRDARPDTPLLLISPLHCGIYEDTPGPGAVDPEDLRRGRIRFTATGNPADVATGRLSLRSAREALAEVVSTREDPNLHFLDGLELFGAQDEAELPLPDDLHPGPAAHALIAERFVPHVFGPGGAFAER